MKKILIIGRIHYCHIDNVLNAVKSETEIGGDWKAFTFLNFLNALFAGNGFLVGGARTESPVLVIAGIK